MSVAARDPERILADYETFKREYVAPGEIASTDALCNGQGIEFVPVVIESHGGGWGREARHVFGRMARHLAAAQRSDEETTGLQTAQRISISLHRENARAVLRRLVSLEPVCPKPEWDPFAEEASDAEEPEESDDEDFGVN